MPNQRPVGVTILAVIFILNAPLILTLIAGIGLWMMRRWGFILAWGLLFLTAVGGLLATGAGLVMSSVEISGPFATLGGAVLFAGVAFLVPAAIALVYLTKRSALFT